MEKRGYTYMVCQRNPRAKSVAYALDRLVGFALLQVQRGWECNVCDCNLR